MPWGLAIGAAVGLAKDELVDVPKEKRERTLAAATQKYSPWTGLQANPIQQADPFSDMLQGGVMGAGVASGLKKGDVATQTENALKAVTPLAMPQLGDSAGYGQTGSGTNGPAWFFGSNPRGVSQPFQSMLGTGN